MRSLLRLLASAALALGLVAMAAVDARAGTTYTPAGGLSVRLTSTNFSITDVPAGQTFTCSQAALSGQVVAPGSGRTFGSAAVGLGALTYTLCSNPIFGPATLTTTAAWTLDVTGPPTGTTWPVRAAGASFTITSANCQLDFSGTVPGTFDTTTQRFAPTPGASTMELTLVDGTMCLTLDFQVGDQMSFGGHFTNVPPTGSTPLSLS